jgi:protein TonB
MLISKFDLYKSEWLELVFDGRNKEYGAYNLRQHYAGNMIRAMGIAFAGITVTAFIVGMIIKPVVSHITPAVDPGTVVVLKNLFIKPPAKPLVHHEIVLPSAAALPHNITKYVPLVVTTAPVTTEPPKTIDLKGEIGPTEVKAPSGTTPISTEVPGTPGGTLPGNETVYTTGTLERLPEPYGGAAAWSKFLQKHLNYPETAIESHAQGRVWISFIVEKDGHLSNFSMDRGAGFGMDEEALRVLRLAPAWRPGIQNGQPVRVKYNIPINFQLGDDNN